jgi:hypothetical protein
MTGRHVPKYEELANQLWERTETDWHVVVFHTLTEPTCAMVNICSDDDELPSIHGVIGTGDVEESIAKACEMIIEKLDEAGYGKKVRDEG